jgi:hypothetical protein
MRSQNPDQSGVNNRRIMYPNFIPNNYQQLPQYDAEEESKTVISNICFFSIIGACIALLITEVILLLTL